MNEFSYTVSFADCLQGTYGGNCAFNCSVGCEGDSCNAVDGACVCKNGYNGTKCEYGKFLLDNSMGL